MYRALSDRRLGEGEHWRRMTHAWFGLAWRAPSRTSPAVYYIHQALRSLARRLIDGPSRIALESVGISSDHEVQIPACQGESISAQTGPAPKFNVPTVCDPITVVPSARRKHVAHRELLRTVDHQVAVELLSFRNSRELVRACVGRPVRKRRRGRARAGAARSDE